MKKHWTLLTFTELPQCWHKTYCIVLLTRFWLQCDATTWGLDSEPEEEAAEEGQHVKDGALRYFYFMLNPEVFHHVGHAPSFGRYKLVAHVALSHTLDRHIALSIAAHTLPADSSSLVFGSFFFLSARWVSKLGIEFKKIWTIPGELKC